MKTTIRQPITAAAALSAACVLLAACASNRSNDWDAWNEGAWTSPEQSVISRGETAGTRTARAETGRTLKVADANHDGKVTREEAKSDPALAAAFDQYDTNKDDALDHHEFEQLVADSRERHPKQTIAANRDPNEPEFSWDPLESTCRHASLSIL